MHSGIRKKPSIGRLILAYALCPLIGSAILTLGFLLFETWVLRGGAFVGIRDLLEGTAFVAIYAYSGLLLGIPGSLLCLRQGRNHALFYAAIGLVSGMVNAFVWNIIHYQPASQFQSIGNSLGLLGWGGGCGIICGLVFWLIAVYPVPVTAVNARSEFLPSW